MDFKSLFKSICYYIVDNQHCSSPAIKRKFHAGYIDACKVIEILEEHKIIESFDHLSHMKVYIKSVTDMEKILDLINK